MDSKASPQLIPLHPEASFGPALIVLHGNADKPENMRPHYEPLVSQGWRVFLACSGQVGKADDYIWTNLELSDQTIQAWGREVGGQPVWAGYSASAYLLMKNAYLGDISASGLICVTPSILRHPSLWPTGWTARPAPVPTAILLGESDPYITLEEVKAFSTEIDAGGAPTRIWTRPCGHEYPKDWPLLLPEMLEWLREKSA